MQVVGKPGSIYEIAGGMETFRRLAAAFYRRVEPDPALRPMYPDDLKGASERLGLFLAQYFGGPTDYNELRGHPRLRMRHAGFRIGPAERDRWLEHMCAAMDEVGILEPVRSTLKQYFEETSTFLINRPASTVQEAPALQ